MSALDWFAIFAVLFIAMAAVSGWMMWFWRRSMRSHETQIKDMVREMRQVIDEEAGRPDNRDDGAKPRRANPRGRSPAGGCRT